MRIETTIYLDGREDCLHLEASDGRLTLIDHLGRLEAVALVALPSGDRYPLTGEYVLVEIVRTPLAADQQFTSYRLQGDVQ